MATIDYNRFDVGIDLRKGASESDANRLRDLKNAYVTTGWQIQKRPGTTIVANLSPGTKGLLPSKGKLHTFHESGSILHANNLIRAHQVAHPSISQAVDSVPAGFVFNGYLYVVAKYADGTKFHHYLDGANPTHVQDANCPHSSEMARGASKIFATDDDVVKYCATNSARDWTTPDDAGFLGTGVQVGGDPDATAIGFHRHKLTAFSRDTAQTWAIDPDPALMSLDEVLENVGTLYPRSISNVAGDLYFLSSFGFRSIATQIETQNLSDVDIGSPIDSLVVPYLQGAITPVSAYYHGAGQYWCAIGNIVFVYSYSRTSKVAAWSYYEYPWPIDDMAELDGVLYLRSGDTVYKVDESVRTDDGETYEVAGQLPYLSMKRPGALKFVSGIDVVAQGAAEYRVLYDARDESLFISVGEIGGDTRPGNIIPVGINGTEIGIRFINNDDQDFRLDAIKMHYDLLGLM